MTPKQKEEIEVIQIFANDIMQSLRDNKIVFAYETAKMIHDRCEKLLK